ncbi:hypothetical protein ABVK25_012393 [Lepraria finkii]|uniref:Uncharacterized protein n=1 Tax=Lepraria finkii TaxID=1340010 RepID=A0ABR4AFJ4_9LECA
MAEAGPAVGETDFTQYLSEREVDEARQLATRGQQRLRDISETQSTFFHFAASYDDHFASVTVRVSPVIPHGSHYTSYNVFASYEPCCTAAQADEVDEQIRLLVQLVYDTCIQAVRRRFDEECCERSPVETSPLTPCWKKKQVFLRWLEQQRLPEAEGPDESDGEDPVSRSPSRPSLSDRATRSNKRQRYDNDDTETSSAELSDVDAEQEGARKRRKTLNDDNNRQLATALIKKAKKGMATLKRKQKSKFDPHVIQAVISRSQRAKMDDEELDTLLSNLEKGFLNYAKRVASEMRPEV